LVSTYLNLKRNAAFFDGRLRAPFAIRRRPRLLWPADGGGRRFSARQLALAPEEHAVRTDLERLSHDVASKEMIALRQAAEVARLRRLETELMTVRRSPVWRTVERLDRIRRRFLRASP